MILPCLMRLAPVLYDQLCLWLEQEVTGIAPEQRFGDQAVSTEGMTPVKLFAHLFIAAWTAALTVESILSFCCWGELVRVPFYDFHSELGVKFSEYRHV